MAYFDAVYFLASTNGVGDFGVASPIQGYRIPAAANVPNGAIVGYRAESSDLTQWEHGLATYNTSGPVLVRSTVLANSSGTTAKIDFIAPPNVGIVELSQDLSSASSLVSGTLDPARIGLRALDQSKLNFTAVIFSGDLDDLKTPGLWNGTALGHSPDGGTGWFYVLVQKHTSDNGYYQQTAWDFGGTSMWMRACQGNVWGKWKKVALIDYVDTAIAAASYNWIINGDFRVNQRSGTRTPGVGVYGYDRWKGHASGLQQVVEALPSGEYTLTWVGGGTGSFAGTTATAPFKATTAGGNISVVVPSNATQVALVRGDATQKTGIFTPRPFSQELALCQRYFEQGVHWIQGNIGSIGQSVDYITMKRASPTVTFFNISASGTSAPTLQNTFITDPTKAFAFNTGPTTNGGNVSFSWKAEAEL